MKEFALLLLRAVTAGFMLSHGVPKMLHGEAHEKPFESMGFVPGTRYAMLAGAVETASAAFIAFGLLGAVGPMMLFSDMLVAINAVARTEKQFSIAGHEIETLYATIAVFLALNGSGRWSVDAAAPLFNKPVWRILSMPGAIGGAALMLSMRRPPIASSGETEQILEGAATTS